MTALDPYWSVSLYKLKTEPCSQALHGLIPPIIPRLPLECACAMLPGPAGDLTRKKMDELGEAYDAAVLEKVKQWNEEQDPSFGVLWCAEQTGSPSAGKLIPRRQAGDVVNLEDWPIEALSQTDCFHPSRQGHQRVAAGFWNRLTLAPVSCPSLVASWGSC